eukprot:GHUV01037719.1.p1 GENE.GHUV01037719.1~~GHUV01037719.1.p1  ORF type:complete len:101 (+),score=4.59 GHUV01037719.1:237-539(+)
MCSMVVSSSIIFEYEPYWQHQQAFTAAVVYSDSLWGHVYVLSHGLPAGTSSLLCVFLLRSLQGTSAATAFNCLYARMLWSMLRGYAYFINIALLLWSVVQ